MNPLNLNEKEFKFVKNLTWEDVWEIWRKNEEHLAHWIEHWQKEGFNSWKEWRAKYLPYNHEREWYLYELLIPLKTISDFRGGSFKGWITRFYGEGKGLPFFSEIIENISGGTRERIEEIRDNFPKTTYLIGAKTEKGVVMIEGMHRAAAVALAKKQDIKISSSIFVALSEVPFSAIEEQLEKIYAKLEERK